MPGRPRIEFQDGPGDYCSQCKDMMSFEGFLQLLSKDGFQHLSRREFEITATTGCPLCMFFCETSNSFGWQWGHVLVLSLSPGFADFQALSGTPAEIMSVLAKSKVGFSKLEGRSRPKTGGKQSWEFSTKVFAVESDPAAQFITPRPVFGYPDEDQIFTIARAWMEDCCHNHRKCCARNTGVGLPARLIDVGDQAITPDVRLHISRPDEAGEYLALSYCWGGEQSVVTTQNNLNSMTQRVTLSSLPRTLQDAIRVTRNMGQRYLWVDALCIVQDSEDDKGREIQGMGSIYKNASLTISAAAASAVSEGFLGRQPKAMPSCKWQLDIPSVGSHTIFISTQPRMFLGYEPNHPLDRRGWALQESLLSHRLLVFSEKEPLWYCQAVRLKSAKDGYLEYWATGNPRNNWVFIDPLRSRSGMQPRNRHGLWTRIVENVTNRLLSDKEDRLNAVAGIAAELQRRWGGKYLFGHWGEGFVPLLLWHGKSPSTEEKSGRAPTWSWGSVNYPVKWEGWLRIKAKAKFTGGNCGHPRVVLTCRTRTLEEVTGLGSRFPPSCFWDHADHTSLQPPGAVLILLGARPGPSRRPEMRELNGIIGIPTESSGGFKRAGIFRMWCSPKEANQILWENVRPKQVVLE